jgi:protein phosphatase PTC6
MTTFSTIPCPPHSSPGLHLEMVKTVLTPSDTKAILHQTNGECLTLTENHHANSRIESARLLRMGNKNVVMDSYGESRWMGAVENTRR